MRALVTGANGFIGSHLVRALLSKGYKVRSFVRPTSDLSSLEGVKTELIYGDMHEAESLLTAVKNCDLLFHVAGIFSYWGHAASDLMDSAKTGMTNVMHAVHQSGIKRVVLTSSSVTLGSTTQKKVITEDHPAPLDTHLAYVASKVEQERLALALAEQLGIDLVTVHPTLTIGGPDYKLTESNHMIVSYLKDIFKTTWIGGCNLVGVDDVAEGHIIAAEKGVAGEAYILGSENLEWPEVHDLISHLTGLPGPYMTAFHTSALLASALHEVVSTFTGQAPSSSIEQAKMVGQYYWYSHDKINRLGYQPQTAKAAMVKALSWLITSSHVPASVRATMDLSAHIHNFRNGI